MMGDKTIEEFIVLLRAGLWEEGYINLNPDVNLLSKQSNQGRANEKVDWEEVYQLAQEQSVQGLVLQGLEELRAKNLELRVPQMLLLQWIGEVQIIEQQNKEMNAFLAELIERLRKNDIYALLVKGQGVAQCYEKPLWRLSGDVDLFLSDSNYEKAKRLLLPLASEVETESVGSKHLGMTIDGFVVELHGTLRSGLSLRVEKGLDEIKKAVFFGGKVRSWTNGGTQVFLLNADEDVVYVFTHLLQHFFKEGLGLRQICDWCRLLWCYHSRLDLQLLESRILKMGLMSEWKAFGAFAVDYLGMPSEAMPMYSADARWKKKADKICSFILEVGNMGHNRDTSYFEKYPYLIRKVCSMWRRCGDLIHHAQIFPLDSLRFFPYMMFNGIISAVRGE